MNSSSITNSLSPAAASSSLTSGLNQPLLSGHAASNSFPLLGSLDQQWLAHELEKRIDLTINLDDFLKIGKEGMINEDGKFFISGKSQIYTEKEFLEYLSTVYATSKSAIKKKLLDYCFPGDIFDPNSYYNQTLKWINRITAHYKCAIQSSAYRLAISQDASQQIQNQRLDLVPAFYPIELYRLEEQFDQSIETIISDSSLLQDWKKSYFMPIVELMKNLQAKLDRSNNYSAPVSYIQKEGLPGLAYPFSEFILSINETMTRFKIEETQVQEKIRTAFAKAFTSLKTNIMENLIGRNEGFYRSWSMEREVEEAKTLINEKRTNQFLICVYASLVPLNFIIGNAFIFLKPCCYNADCDVPRAEDYFCKPCEGGTCADCCEGCIDLRPLSYGTYSIFSPCRTVKKLNSEIETLKITIKDHPGMQIMK